MVVLEFVKKYWQYLVMLLLAIIIAIIGVLFTIQSNQNVTLSKKIYILEQKELENVAKEGEKAAQAAKDSGDIFTKAGDKEGAIVENIHNQSKKLEHEMYKEISDADSIPYSSVAGEYSRLSEEYHFSTRGLYKDSN